MVGDKEAVNTTTFTKSRFSGAGGKKRKDQSQSDERSINHSNTGDSFTLLETGKKKRPQKIPGEIGHPPSLERKR